MPVMYAEKQTADFTYRAACDFIDMLVLGECISRCILRQLVFYFFWPVMFAVGVHLR